MKVNLEIFSINGEIVKEEMHVQELNDALDSGRKTLRQDKTIKKVVIKLDPDKYPLSQTITIEK